MAYASVEFNNNRLALYCAQQGRCAVTKEKLKIGEIHCHHQVSRKSGGTDCYDNLILICETVHILIHAMNYETMQKNIQSLMIELNLKTQQWKKLSSLRKIAGLPLNLKM